jgi:hypothetical protein
MCTITWLDDPDGGYALLFNRDERRSRGAAAPPTVAACDGVPYLAPTDRDAGGTWLGVNAHGVTVGLLNHYVADAARTADAARVSADAPRWADTRAPEALWPSRGQLVRRLMACATVDDVVHRLADAETAAAFRPFEVLTLDTGGGRVRATWDGRSLAIARAPVVRPPISSSGFATAEVLAVRAATYDVLVGPDPAAARPDVGDRLDGPARLARLEAFQRSHVPERGGFSVCMHRPEAHTVSLTMLGVEREQVWMRYGPGPACTAVLGRALTLPRCGGAR